LNQENSTNERSHSEARNSKKIVKSCNWVIFAEFKKKIKAQVIKKKKIKKKN
jgi:hypothetical protein